MPRTALFGTPKDASYEPTFYPRAQFDGNTSDASIPAAYATGLVGFVTGCTVDVAANSSSGILGFGYCDATTFAYSNWFTMSSSALSPSTDNNKSLGTASLRYSVVYAGTGTINTSDEDYKTFCDEELSDAVLDVWEGINWRAYKFNDSIEQKGIDNARVHFGLGAQTVKKAFEDAGLDAFKYGLLCYDEWEGEPEQTTTVILHDLIVDNKTLRVQADETEINSCLQVLRDLNNKDVSYELTNETQKTVVTKASVAGGSRYGIRYEEALALEAALMRRMTKILTEKLSALESK